MAIAEMKRMTLIGMNADKARILRKLQKLGCVEITRTAEEDSQAEQTRLAELRDKLSRVEWSIKKLGPFDPVKAGLFAQRPVADGETLAAVQAGEGELLEKISRLEELERSLGDIRARELKAQAAIKRLTPWKALDVPFAALRGGGRVRFALLVAQPNRLEEFKARAAQIDPLPEIQVMPVFEGKAGVAVACHESALEETEALERSLGLERAQLDEFSQTPQAEIAALEKELSVLQNEREKVNREMADMGGDLPSLRVYRDTLALAQSRQEAASRIASTQSAFLLEGWTPASACPQVESAVKRAGRDVCLEFRDPLDEEQPPTLLVNNKLVQPFEAVIEMFSMPDPRSFDPTAIMAPFFAMLFGFMVSDAGYGIVLMLLTGLYIWQVKPRGTMAKMARIIFWGGAGTLFWGALFGGWFGETWHPFLFAPLDDPVNMMILCAVIGLIHVLTGVGIAAYMNIKRGRVWDAVWDQGMWFLILLGVAALAVGFAQVGKWMALAGVAGILLFGGRAKKNPFSRLIGGAGKLYDVTSYLGDILSYMRLFGMGLATGVIGMVFNLLAGIVMGSIPGMIAGIVIMIVGHTFNLAINALGAYVNACRLQYIEFFGHFYEQGGVQFKPLMYETRYVDIDPMYDVE